MKFHTSTHIDADRFSFQQAAAVVRVLESASRWDRKDYLTRLLRFHPDLDRLLQDLGREDRYDPNLVKAYFKKFAAQRSRELAKELRRCDDAVALQGPRILATCDALVPAQYHDDITSEVGLSVIPLNYVREESKEIALYWKTKDYSTMLLHESLHVCLLGHYEKTNLAADKGIAHKKWEWIELVTDILLSEDRRKRSGEVRGDNYPLFKQVPRAIYDEDWSGRFDKMIDAVAQLELFQVEQ